MKLKPLKCVPLLIALGVIAAICLLRSWNPDFCEGVERMTFDVRVRTALHFHPSVATNLGFVFIDEDSLKAVWNGSLGYSFGLLWPRQVYGRLVHELSLQGVKAVALDIILGEIRKDHAPVLMADGNPGPESDEFFANEMQRAGNVIIAITHDVIPPNWFLTNAVALGDISADKDFDGILRRAQAFRIYRHWHDAFRQLEADPEYAVDLSKARIEPTQIVLPRSPELGDIKVPLDSDGNFDLADFGGEKLPEGTARHTKPFVDRRVWHMGVVLAARQLNLDLDQPLIDLANGRITLRGPGNLERTIPVDAEGYFFIDWCLPESDPRLAKEAIQNLLLQDRHRLLGQTNGLADNWRDKLVVVGSRAVLGNNLTDRGATPLESDTLLVSKHWNVANSILTGRFVHRTSLNADLALIAALGAMAGVVTWRLRVLMASTLILLSWVIYALIAFGLYVESRVWIPLFLPLGGALLMTHVSLVTWRVVFEQAERRRVKAVLSTIVSPKIANVLLQAERLALGGARREVTVVFADVRGFTEFTDASQEAVAEHVRRNNLSGESAEACFDKQARETLDTINLYLGTVAETMLQHEGVLDKFIGDCVMAFWGAPNPDPKHATACVRAAIDAQRAIHELNRSRIAENKRRQAENAARAGDKGPDLSLLPILFLGTGINTGMATVGLMGSQVKSVVRQGNYTVFGREVNLASRLESRSGRGRIFIGEATYRHLLRDDPVLAAKCVALPGQTLKGIATAVTIYEVPWRLPEMAPLEEELIGVASVPEPLPASRAEASAEKAPSSVGL